MRTLTIDGTPLTFRRARVEEIIDLRHAILRHGLPRSEAVFDGDEAETSRHYAALSGSLDAPDGVIGCATLHLVAWRGEPAWQLRGMATAPGFRGRGVGRELMALLESDLLADRPTLPRLLWCNARVPALGFYQRQGWDVVSEQFDIPTAGPHFRMVKRLRVSPSDQAESRR